MGSARGMGTAGMGSDEVPTPDGAEATSARDAAVRDRTDASATPGAEGIDGPMDGGPPSPSDGATPQGDDAAGAVSSAADAGAPCTREILSRSVDAYFAALAARDPAMLPLAEDARHTENGLVIEPGEGLWRDAGSVVYAHSALDTAHCSSASEAVVPEGGANLPVALRLKLVDAPITEVETIVARPGDYVAFGTAFESDPDAISSWVTRTCT